MGKTVLTKRQRESVEWAAKCEGAGLYTETSLSGVSETLRYWVRYAENTPSGPILRNSSGMILSVPTAPFEGDTDGNAYTAKQKALFDAKVAEAFRLFNELRDK